MIEGREKAGRMIFTSSSNYLEDHGMEGKEEEVDENIFIRHGKHQVEDEEYSQIDEWNAGGDRSRLEKSRKEWPDEVIRRNGRRLLPKTPEVGNGGRLHKRTVSESAVVLDGSRNLPVDSSSRQRKEGTTSDTCPLGIRPKTTGIQGNAMNSVTRILEEPRRNKSSDSLLRPSITRFLANNFGFGSKDSKSTSSTTSVRDSSTDDDDRLLELEDWDSPVLRKR